ncbi:APC family permease [bacterium]|nr:APC family permease [bacterium]MBU1936654.1 APC family permease [bacterium]
MPQRKTPRNSAHRYNNKDVPPGMAPGEDDYLPGELLHSGWFSRVKQAIIGRARNPFDPRVFHNISLIAFFAWVGLGADGLSSACYGPEEAFLALREFPFLAPFLAIIIAGTVLIISRGYMLVIEEFSTGGGGYLVASKLISPRAGAIAGSALVVDYVLTIAVSVAAGADAVFSLLPGKYHFLRVPIAILAIFFLVLLNLRGVKESVLTLLPIFMIFVVSHVALLFYGLVIHLTDITVVSETVVTKTTGAIGQYGFFFILLILFRAYSMGAGTLTGIEAVANGMLVLKEPRVQTGKRTMVYMAISLAFMAAALMFNFLFFDIRPIAGKTLNAVLFSQMVGTWHIAGWQIGQGIVWVMLVSEALILFVAAQTGFIGGPRVLANMAEDKWMPHRFGHLSERLVTQNGIILMGLGAVALVLYARGNVQTLVMLYAINVFVDFTLSQFGMSRLWLSKRKILADWKKRLAINATGFVVAVVTLTITVSLKFFKGGWLIITITGCLVLLCFVIRRHYEEVNHKLKQVDEILKDVPMGEVPVTPQKLEAKDPTAVVLVSGFNGVGVHVLLNIHRLFGFRFKQYVFLSVGTIDSGHFKGAGELEELKKATDTEVERYVKLARSYGLKTEGRSSAAIDYLDEMEKMCLQIQQDYSNSVFFAARLLFWRDTLWNRLLHNETALSIQRRLLFHGIQMMILPVRLR